MKSYEILRRMFEILRESEPSTIRYIANQCNTAKTNIWHKLRIMKALGMIDEKYSDKRPNIFVYKLKQQYLCQDMNKLMEKYYSA